MEMRSCCKNSGILKSSSTNAKVGVNYKRAMVAASHEPILNTIKSSPEPSLNERVTKSCAHTSQNHNIMKKSNGRKLGLLTIPVIMSTGFVAFKQAQRIARVKPRYVIDRKPLSPVAGSNRNWLR
jgi:hypothetical protein